TSSTAEAMRAASAAGSTGTPSSLAYIVRTRSSGRGRLPVCVVRKRSVLRFMTVPRLLASHWRVARFYRRSRCHPPPERGSDPKNLPTLVVGRQRCSNTTRRKPAMDGAATDGASRPKRSGNEELVSEIVAFCRRVGMAESTFGRRAVNDGKFVSRLRVG